MKLFKDIYNFLIGEQSEPKLANQPKALARAIKERHPVSFFYNGPRGKVQPGRRVKAEMVALGLSKKGNMVVRAWVEPPSRSKTGFNKGNWRTFMVGRMNQIEIFDQETFDQKRPGYKDGDDNSMSVTYVTPNWSDNPEPPQPKKPEAEPNQPEVKTDEPQKEKPIEPQNIEPQRNELPQPEPENRPSMEPPVIDDEDEVEDEENNYDSLNENIKRIKQLLYK